jgi:mono/diheme cytochrome c family protein
MNTKYYISIIAALFILSSSAFAQDDWGITDEEKATTLQVDFTPDNIEMGGDVYEKSCKSCHGDIGQNNAIAPTFPDLGSGPYFANTDGELYYKITKGKGAMPTFEKAVSESDRWKVVAYIRSFDKDYQPAGGEAVALAPGEKFAGKVAAIELVVDQENHKLIAKLQGKDAAGNSVIPSGVKVMFYADRMFNDFLIGKAVKCDASGTATIDYPADLPADTAGMMTFYAQLKDQKLGTLKGEATVDTGKPMIYKNPLSERVMWGPMANIPLWLLFTYLGILLVVWSGIGYVGLQLVKIWMLREQ